MKNNRSPNPRGISNELLKYVWDVFCSLCMKYGIEIRSYPLKVQSRKTKTKEIVIAIGT